MKILNFFLAMGMVLLLAGCLETREEINDMESGKQAQEQVTAIQKSRADDQSKIFALQDDLRQANGRMDLLEKKLQDAQTQLAKMQEVQSKNEGGPTNKDIVDQMKIFEQTITQIKAQMDDLQTKMATLSKAKADKMTAAAQVKDPWAVAEALFAKKDWKNAILNYQAYRDQNPKSSIYSLATYKIGVCFEELKMKDEATAFYQEVIQKFPKSGSAKKAKFRLSQMK